MAFMIKLHNHMVCVSPALHCYLNRLLVCLNKATSETETEFNFHRSKAQKLSTRLNWPSYKFDPRPGHTNNLNIVAMAFPPGLVPDSLVSE